MRTDAAVAPVAASPSLAAALDALRSRGLEMRRGTDAPTPDRSRPAVPTGHPALDAALGSGGWPRGGLALLDAPAGSGGTTLAMNAVVACHVAGGLAGWLDVDGTFDPAVASRLGVDPEWVLVGRPLDAAEALDLAGWLVRSGHVDVLVIDLGLRSAPDRRALDRLAALLSRSGTTAGVLLAPAGRVTAGAVAGVRVALRRTAWLAVGSDVVGQRVVAAVERHRWAIAGASAEIDLWFGEGRRIDPLVPALAEARPPAEVLPVERRELRVVGG